MQINDITNTALTLSTVNLMHNLDGMTAASFCTLCGTISTSFFFLLLCLGRSVRSVGIHERKDQLTLGDRYYMAAAELYQPMRPVDGRVPGPVDRSNEHHTLSPTQSAGDDQLSSPKPVRFQQTFTTQFKFLIPYSTNLSIKHLDCC